MAYNRPRNPQISQKDPVQQKTGPNIGDFVDVGRSGLAGFWQGLSGKNKTYEQWLREKKRKKQGFPTPGSNWLQRLITPK